MTSEPVPLEDRPVGRGIPRLVEAAVALLGLVALSPILAGVALAITVCSRGPVLFRQVRMGRNGKTFVLYKFRTMRVLDAVGPQITAGDDSRIFGIGRVLRHWKLDELPELWNVLRGDMSLVGPRPEVPPHVDLDDPLWKEVLRVRPGLTDPVTLQLRNEEELLARIDGDRDRYYREKLQPWKLAGYAEYTRRRSAWRDLTVLWRTALAVVFPGRAIPGDRDRPWPC